MYFLQFEANWFCNVSSGSFRLFFTGHKKIFEMKKLNMKQTEWLPHIDNKNMEVQMYSKIFYIFF